jgi:hypothetical protein
MSILLKGLPRWQLNQNASASIQVPGFNEEAATMKQDETYRVMASLSLTVIGFLFPALS